jgi:NAD(P)-dependent dehydrogenase (short-subunit alcohol dehydrogenase family)
MSPPDKKVALVIGASRGIGRQIALSLADEGYTGTYPPSTQSALTSIPPLLTHTVVVSAKSTSDPVTCTPFPPDPNSRHSTINTVALEIQRRGGTALALPADTRSAQSISTLVSTMSAQLGRLDVLVYNAGAIWWGSVAQTPLARFQLMQAVNVDGLYAAIQAALPVFEAGGWQGRIVVVAPPIYSRFFRGKTAYAVGKVGMSVLVKGLGMDFERQGRSGMAVSALWPAVAVKSAATGESDDRDLRTPDVFADAVVAMVRAPADEVNGCLELDEDFLRKKGVTDFSRYSVVPGATPRRIMPAELPDLRVKEQDDEGTRMDSTKMRAAKI